MAQGKIKTRFAPSPTGELHIGGLRTALFNHLLAKRYGGTFLLRIEDTDQARLVKGAADRFMSHLAWAGIVPDEGEGVGGPNGPYTQSLRLEFYREIAHQLLAQGKAYKVKIKGKRAYAIKVEIPLDCPMFVWKDAVLGELRISPFTIKDFVILKSDGFPTYHLASVVDDHLMGITCVMRGMEWIASTPLHLLLYRLLGWEPPVFGHLPLILDGDRKKLSKRNGASSVSIYRDNGINPNAMINYLALLGWSPGNNKELFSMDELRKEFSFKRLRKAPSMFDERKLRWMNTQHSRQP